MRRAGENAPIIAGLAAGLFAPVATLGFGTPLALSLPATALIFAGLWLALGRRRLFEGFAHGDEDLDNLELARAVLTDAAADLAKLESLSREVRRPAARASLVHLHAVAMKAVAEVEAEPRRVNAVRRLLTYYLPAAVRLGEGCRILEGSLVPDPERLGSAEAMLAKLDAVFTRHADRLIQAQVDDLDLEIRLLEESIREEQRR